MIPANMPTCALLVSGPVESLSFCLVSARDGRKAADWRPSTRAKKLERGWSEVQANAAAVRFSFGVRSFALRVFEQAFRTATLSFEVF